MLVISVPTAPGTGRLPAAADRHWLALAVISAVVLVASIVVGYPTGGLFAVLGLLLSAWRLHWYPKNLLTTIQPPGNRPR